MSNVMKVTETGNSYWDGTGAYQAEYKEMYDALVPIQGEADTVNGELIRSVSRLTHDYFNNGNGNARVEIYADNTGSLWYDEDEDEDEDDSYFGNDEDDYETEISDFFLHFTDFIVTTIGTDEIETVITDICDIITDDENPAYEDKTVDKYNKMADIVMHYVMTHENQPREINQD